MAVAIVAGIAVWYLRSLPSSVRVETVAHAAAGPSPGGGSPASATAAPTPSVAAIVVYVSGWVRHPGVYEFRTGDRVVDALRAAGGARPGADLDSINLAQQLADGQQVMVAKKGTAASGGSAVSGGGSSGTSGAGDTGPINLNTATLEQLESLPGIGPSLGQRILDYRTAHGPFRSVQDLLNVSGIGEKRLADLEPLVTV